MIKDLSFDDDQLIKSDINDLNDTLIKITKPNALSTASADTTACRFMHVNKAHKPHAPRGPLDTFFLSGPKVDAKANGILVILFDTQGAIVSTFRTRELSTITISNFNRYPDRSIRSYKSRLIVLILKNLAIR